MNALPPIKTDSKDPVLNIFSGLTDEIRERLDREREERILIENQVRREDSERSISAAIWSMMLFTIGRWFGKLLAKFRISPPIARGVKPFDDRAAMPRTASDKACAKAVVKSAKLSSSCVAMHAPLVSKTETSNVRAKRPEASGRRPLAKGPSSARG